MSAEIMSVQEIHEFGLQILIEHLGSKGYEIEFAQPEKQQLPHIVAKKDDTIVFILAATDVYPNKGAITDLDKQALIEHANKFNAQVACAYLGIANKEGIINKDKSLCAKASKDAEFYTDFGGLEFIHFEE